MEVNLPILVHCTLYMYLRVTFQVEAPGWFIFGEAFLHYPLGGLIFTVLK